MSGIELCRTIRQFMPRPVILAVTGHARLFDVRQCHAAGFDGYFDKPVPMARLLAAADLVFEKRAVPAAGFDRG
jgi:CheY-like chemotaxis protein